MDIKDGFRRENYNCMASCPWAQDILDAIERGDVKLEDYDLSSGDLCISVHSRCLQLDSSLEKVLPASSLRYQLRLE